MGSCQFKLFTQTRLKLISDKFMFCIHLYSVPMIFNKIVKRLLWFFCDVADKLIYTFVWSWSIGIFQAQRLSDVHSIPVHVSAGLIEFIMSVSESPRPTAIHLNSAILPNQTEVVLNAGSKIKLSCHGDGLVCMSTNAFSKLSSEKDIKADPRHTGTYNCRYANQSLSHLDTWIHLYVKGKQDLNP